MVLQLMHGHLRTVGKTQDLLQEVLKTLPTESQMQLPPRQLVTLPKQLHQELSISLSI
jgi:hypothetical protein